MKINLIPISQLALETIEINTDEFILGRMEEPFVSAPKEISSYVSRRHAKIFYSNENFSIVDLGSQNGTKVNGYSIDEQVVLKQGDEIEISVDLRFQVEIINPVSDATILTPRENTKLVLEPVDKQSGLNILVVTAFPFLISKEAGVFPSFQKDYPEEISRISRRHAYISHEQGNFILTDMESTNGTLINNDKLDKQGKTLQTGDVISFGGSFFSYTVKLSSLGREKVENTTVGGSNNIESEPVSNETYEPRTTYVNDPNPFLDILCDEGGAGTNEQSEPASPRGAGNESASTSQNSSSFISKKLLFLRQIFSAFSSNNTSAYNRLPIYLSSILLLAVAGGALFFWLNKSDDIGALIKQGHYVEAAELSTQMLAESPEDATLLKLSTKAVLNSLVPKWQSDLDNSNFSRAKILITDAQSKYAGTPDLEKAQALMQWINQLYQFMSTRITDTRIIIFQNEDQLSSLMEAWEKNKKQNEITLGLINRSVPGFKATYDKTLSFIRTLEHDQDIYIHAIAELKSSLVRKLQQDQTDELMEEVVRFEKKYTAISGFEDLMLDIRHYIELNDALKFKDMEILDKMPQEVLFQTPLFKRFSQQTIPAKRPSKAFINQYYDAIHFWQTGDTENAIKNLKALSSDSWSEAAKKKFIRYQLIIDRYAALEGSRKTNKYLGNLFNFHTLLESPEDTYYLNAIENDFQKNKSQAVKVIQKHINTAQASWQRYVSNGGISGLLRLENYISKKYLKQARLLASANNDIIYAKHLDTALQMPDNKKWRQVSSKITEEIAKQTKWLGDLELVIKPSVLKQKLDLMKVTEEL